MKRKLANRNKPGKGKRARFLASMLLAGALAGCGARSEPLPDTGNPATDADISHDVGLDSALDSGRDSGRDSRPDSEVEDSGLGQCAPPEECSLEIPTVVTLGEGEEFTIHGWTVHVNEIFETVVAPDSPGGPCPIMDEGATLRIDRIISGFDETVTLYEGECHVNGCISLEVGEITEDVGAADSRGICEITNERVRVTLTIPRD